MWDWHEPEGRVLNPCTDGRAREPREGGLYALSYVSNQAAAMDNAALLKLLDQARRRNADLGITGLLLHRENCFFQVLEGVREEVLSLFEQIASDKRHQRVEIVSEGPIGTREYSDWRMAFIELDGQDFTAMPGFSDLLKATPGAREFLHGLSRSKKLALLFSVMD